MQLPPGARQGLCPPDGFLARERGLQGTRDPTGGLSQQTRQTEACTSKERGESQTTPLLLLSGASWA